MTGLHRVAVLAALLLLLAGNFLFFPGRTFLQSDTQIYLPILDRLENPALYASDPVALRPHVSYTIYDEAALLLRRLTGAEFQTVLAFQQLVYRFAGLIGVFLLGRAGGLTAPLAILLASFFGLGATIVGPSVLIAEYEPVPRGFAVPLLLFAIGLSAQERWILAGVAAGWAAMYHPPTTVPVLAVGAMTMWMTRRRSGEPDRRWQALLPVLGAAALLFLLSRLQRGASEPQQLFSTIDPALEKLQRLRGSYNFVSIWIGRWWPHWLFVATVFVFSWWRLRAALPRFHVCIGAGLTLYGLAMAPVSFLLLEQAKWSMTPQFQPARALLWVTLMAILGAAWNGILAAQQGRFIASLLWFVPAFCLPAQLDPAQLPRLALNGDATALARLGVFFGLAALAALAVRLPHPTRLAALAATLVLPFYLMNEVAKAKNYPVLDHPEIHALADWAQANTSVDTVFQFPDAGQALYPGLFRVFAKRTVYADWKVGGQVNLLKEFADEWWARWQAAGAPKVVPATFTAEYAPKLAGLGIQYVVLQPKNRLPDRAPDYENTKYLVYRTSRP